MGGKDAACLVEEGVLERSFADGRVEIMQGDITKISIDIVVTAANSGLKGGGGVDGAIHRASGPRLLSACRAIGGCPTGEAVITEAFELARKGVQYVVHTVGPVWRGGAKNEEALLKSAYESSLKLASAKGVRSIAFPSISTGVYGFPVDKAAPVALSTCKRFLESSDRQLKRIVFVLFDQKTYDAYLAVLARMEF